MSGTLGSRNVGSHHLACVLCPDVALCSQHSPSHHLPHGEGVVWFWSSPCALVMSSVLGTLNQHLVFL